jgi:hypothetical protein
MILTVTRWCVLGLTVCAATSSTVFGQTSPKSGFKPVSLTTVVPSGELSGTIHDERGQPLNGAIVSAQGSTMAFEVSDREGRFMFRGLSPGAYLVRAHLQGYVAPRGSYVRVSAGARQVWAISMNRATASVSGAPPETGPVLAAGLGASDTPSTPVAPTEEDDSEVNFRLRHIKRGVLKDAHLGVIDASSGDDPFEQRLAELGRAIGSSARLASALFADLTLNGQINLLTTTSFNRPQDLFSVDAATPRPIAYISLVAPGGQGDWTMRGSMTQGDISSWIVSGAYARHAPAAHRYEAGLSYAVQQYQGGNAEALAAMSGGSRNVGELYVYDAWTITPQVTVGVGGKYASYGYLTDRALLGGRMSVTLQPSMDDPLKLRVSASHREIAPGAEEFVPPTAGIWLPPERTFSSLTRGVFRPERLNHVEIGGEREFPGAFIVGVRAFRQEIDDQIVTLFGLASPEIPATLGHYHVDSAGDFRNYGWGIGLSRAGNRAVQASLDYTQVDVSRRGLSGDEDALFRVASSLVRHQERIHDVTASINSRFPVTATRFLIVYKVSNAYAGDADSSALANARFEVQINQEIPFLNFTGASWEMLLGMRNLFRADLFDGSVYDELLVLHPPKRVIGGVTVRF